MSEKVPSLKELILEINKIVKTLGEIALELTVIDGSQKKPAQPAKTRTVDEVEKSFPMELADLLSFEDRGKIIFIKPRQFLGTAAFKDTIGIVKDLGGQYVKAGKESHFEIPK
jgi:hypothetical protein